MRKIKIIGKGLPKFQQQPGTVGNFQCPPGEKFDETLGQCIPDINYSSGTTLTTTAAPVAEQYDFNGCVVGKEVWSVADQKCIPIDQQEPPKFQINPTLSTGTPKTGPGTGVNPQGTQLNLNPDFYKKLGVAQASVGLLSSIADKLQYADLQRRTDRAQRKFGMTDSRFGPMRNVYSYGRTPTGYAYNQMVPVQFAGKPTFETMTVPQFAQDGIEVVRDIMQLPTLYTSDPTASGLYAEDPAVEAAMNKRYADIDLPSASIDLTAVLNIPAVGPELPALASSKKGGKEISYSHNNPLNIHYGGFAKKYGANKGAYDNMGNVAIFPNLNAGIQAAKDLLFGSSYIDLNISEARNRWVNGKEDAYTPSSNSIVKAMGKDVKLSQLTLPERDKLIKLFAKWEGKQGYNLIKDMPLYKEGGEYDLSDDEIKQILANGGQIEFL